jgi:predicted nucleotide-binding protein
MPKPRIFIASAGESLKVANAIQANLDHDAECTVWNQGVMRLARNTMENLAEQLGKSDFGIFVFNADDVVLTRGKKHAVARDNVILELGLFAGRLGLGRTFIVKPRGVDIKLPSDLLGITPADYDRDRDDLQAALGSACTAIREELKDFSSRGTP